MVEDVGFEPRLKLPTPVCYRYNTSSIIKIGAPGTDSNLQPQPYKGFALPIRATGALTLFFFVD
jgi:hypothetical protein